MPNNSLNTLILFVFIFGSCNIKNNTKPLIKKSIHKEIIIVDCNYTFREAIKGSSAPESILNQLEIINVRYFSFDNKIHQGQLVVNKSISKDILAVFRLILSSKFPVSKVVPIVKYNWNDELSMENNNTYSFCYRNIYYSRHAYGMAIDINPQLNPLRWKKGFENRMNRPFGATYNPEKAGTFSINSKVVHEFKIRGFIWGHCFKQKYDDHHFEKYSY